jgi:hypothetical protein
MAKVCQLPAVRKLPLLSVDVDEKKNKKKQKTPEELCIPRERAGHMCTPHLANKLSSPTGKRQD